MYKLAEVGVIRLSDGATIRRNTLEWEDYRQWRLAGNVATPADPPPPPPTPSTAETIACLTVAVQRHMDTTARARGYDNILSACSYATSANMTFAAEGQACVVWRDAVWVSCYTLMAEVQAGTRAVPSEAQLLALLPTMVWPPA